MAEGQGVACTLVNKGHKFDVLVGYHCDLCELDVPVIVFRKREEDHSFLMVCPSCVDTLLEIFKSWNVRFDQYRKRGEG